MTKWLNEKQEFDWLLLFFACLFEWVIMRSMWAQRWPYRCSGTYDWGHVCFFLLRGDRTLFLQHVMIFNLSAEVFQHVLLNGTGQDRTGLVCLISQRTTVFLGPWPHLFQMQMQRWQDLTKVALLGFFRSGLVNESLATLKWCV